MKVLIASDIHGSHKGISLFAAQVGDQKPDLVILLGDILYHGPRNPLPEAYDPKEVIEVLSGLNSNVALVRGNCDSEVDQMVLPFQFVENLFLADADKMIFACHGHNLPDDQKEIKLQPDTAVLSGHTHIPKAEQRGIFHFWNPGSVSLPKENNPPSYGFYENGLFEVRDFSGKTLMKDRL